MSIFRLAVSLLALQFSAPLTTAKSESVTMPLECENMSFCTHKGKYYPDNEVNKLDERKKLPKSEFNMGGTFMGSRSSIGDSEITLCPAIDTINTLIYHIVDSKNKTRAVVQLPGVFQQVFSLQQCVNAGPVRRTVGLVTSDVSGSTDMYCANIYYQHEFFVLSDDGTRLEKTYSRDGLPVHCACKYRNSQYTQRGDFMSWNEY